MEFETNGRTDGQTRTATTSNDRRRHAAVDVAATRDKPTYGQMPRIFAASVHPSVS